MTLPQFLAALRDEVEGDWTTADTAIGERLRCRLAGDTREHCPLTALVFVRHQQSYGPHQAKLCANILGIHASDAHTIMTAADRGSVEAFWHDLMLATIVKRHSSDSACVAEAQQ